MWGGFTLCPTYALINASIHHPIENEMDVLPAIPPLRLELIENPDANPQIRDAISDAVAGFDAVLAKGAKPHDRCRPLPCSGPLVIEAEGL